MDDHTSRQRAALRAVYRSIPQGLRCLLTVVLAASPISSQEQAPGHKSHLVRPSRSELVQSSAEEILRIQEKIRSVQADALRNRKSRVERLRELAAEKRAVERTLSSMVRERDRLHEEIEKKKLKLESIQEHLAEAKGQSAVLADHVRRYLDYVERFVAKSIRWQQFLREESIRSARSTLEGDSPDPAGALAAAGRVQKEEESLARLVETGTVRVEAKNKETIAVSAFHIGLLAVVLSSEDGQVIGFARASQTLEEGIAAVREDPFAAEGYLKAVDILRRRRTPELVDLFFPALPVKPEKGAAE